MKFRFTVFAFVLLFTALAGGAWAYFDDFATGVDPNWANNQATAWSWNSAAQAYSGGSTSDTSTWRPDWTVAGDFTYAADATVVSQPYGAFPFDLVLFKPNMWIGVMAEINHYTESGGRKSNLISIQTLSDTGQWGTPLTYGWDDKQDTTFHLALQRLDDTSLKFSVTGNLGFSWSGTTTLDKSFLDNLATPGLRVNGTSVNFDNVSLSQVPEPASILAILTGIGGLLAAGIRNRRLF